MARKRRLEVIIEKMAYKRACRVLVEAGLTGYTVVPALAGYGGGRRWDREADISGSTDMVVIITIGEDAVIEAALKNLANIFASHIGVLNVSDVDVMRPELF